MASMREHVTGNCPAAPSTFLPAPHPRPSHHAASHRLLPAPLPCHECNIAPTMAVADVMLNFNTDMTERIRKVCLTATAASDIKVLLKLRCVSKFWQRAVESHVLDVVAAASFLSTGAARAPVPAVKDVGFESICAFPMVAAEKARLARQLAADWVVLAMVSHVRESGNTPTSAVIFCMLQQLGCLEGCMGAMNVSILDTL